jgi:hypothetical protein
VNLSLHVNLSVMTPAFLIDVCRAAGRGTRAVVGKHPVGRKLWIMHAVRCRCVCVCVTEAVDELTAGSTARMTQELMLCSAALPPKEKYKACTML